MDANATTNGSTGDCISGYTTSVFQAVAIVRATSGAVSAIASILVILLIVVFKKYLFFTQKLILYLSIASLLNSITIALQGAVYFPDNISARYYCGISGFLEQTTHWSLLLAVSSITIDIYLKAIHGIQTRRSVYYAIVTFTFPVTINWIPFVNQAYGRSGPWCWITSNCGQNIYGTIYQYVLWYMPLYTVVLGIMVIYVIAYLSIRKQKQGYRGNYDPNRKERLEQMTREVISLAYYPIIFLLLQVFPTINRVAEAFGYKHLEPLWFLHAFFSPLQGGLMCIVYALDPETRAQLRKLTLRSLIHYGNFQDRVHEYPTELARSDSATNSLKAKYTYLEGEQTCTIEIN